MFFGLSSHSTPIERLRTEKQVQKFLIKYVDQRFKKIAIFGKDLTPRIPASKRFYKIDIDKDGQTDLVINGIWLLVILDKGDNNYQTEYINGSAIGNRAQLSKIDTSQGVVQLVVQRASKDKLDTLIYRHGCFIEPQVDVYEGFNLEEVRFYVYGCRLDCPRYNMVIGQSGAAKYYPMMYVPKTGTYTGVIAKAQLDSLAGLLAYINPDKLSDTYSPPFYHSVAVTLKLKYNGKVKTVNDNYSDGTFGLQLVYSILKRWARETEWHE